MIASVSFLSAILFCVAYVHWQSHLQQMNRTMFWAQIEYHRDMAFKYAIAMIASGLLVTLSPFFYLISNF